MSWLGRRVIFLVSLVGVAACQQPATETVSKPTPPVVEVTPASFIAPAAEIDWTRAPDCRAMLPVLQAGLEDGRILDLGTTPFFLIHDQPAGASRMRPTFGGRIDTGSSSSDARCILRVGQAGEHDSDHRILGREQVRSRYQSGTRVEKNPAYEVAKARLKHAEKSAKPGGSSIIKVGDPLLDLVGTLVGGALTGLGQWGAGDQLEEALDRLMETPPSIEHPKYRDYHFERARVRASREATLAVMLTDRRLQKSWQASLKRRENRELYLVTGLDRQDEHYARHSENSLTEDGLGQWLAEVPSLPIEDMVAVLLDRPSSMPIDRLALNDGVPKPKAPVPTPEAPASFADDGFLDAAVLPTSGLGDMRSPATSRSTSGPGSSASRIAIFGETARAEGVYIAPHLILTPSTVIGARGLVDVEDSPGHKALGLVAAVDHGLGLALIQAPTPGRPAPIGGIADAWQGRAANDVVPDRGFVIPATGQNSTAAQSAPLLVGGRLVGFRTAGGPDITIDAIQVFLDRQRHLLSADETTFRARIAAAPDHRRPDPR